jgi:hypothetical protein
VVLDVIFPPYDDELGRTCTYYSRSDASQHEDHGAGEAPGRGEVASVERTADERGTLKSAALVGAGGGQLEGTKKRRRDSALGGRTALVPIQPEDFAVERAETE